MTRQESSLLHRHHVSIRPLGRMATGSYGVEIPAYSSHAGRRIIEPWAVICPRAPQPSQGFVFRLQTEAEAFAVAEAHREEGREIERRAKLAETKAAAHRATQLALGWDGYQRVRT